MEDMDEIKLNDFSKICRFCLKIKEILYLLFYEFQTENDGVDRDGGLLKINHRSSGIIEMIYLCTGLKISKDDGLPPFICNICMGNLKMNNNFRQQCHSSNEYLKKILKNCTLKTTSKTPELIETTSDKKIFIIDEVNEDDYDNVYNDYDNVIDNMKSELEFVDYNIPISLNNNDDNAEENNKDDTKNVKKKCNRKKENKILQLDNDKKKQRYGQCQICGTFQMHLQTHMIVHTGERKFECDMCGKRFAQKSNLQKHIDTHTNIRLNKCKICDKKFLTPANLRRHTRIHTGERNFQCDICGKTFIQPSGRNGHRLTHTQERKHKCEHCNKLFLTSTGLRSHIGIHTGQRPYKCGFCPKTFINSSGATVHRRIHLIDNAFECSICKMRIQHLQSLKLHLKNEHAKNLQYI